MFTNILRCCVISIIFFIFLILPAVSVSAAPVAHAAGDGEVISKVICNVVVFV
ncbi:MAG: type IV secretion system protein VirB2-8, partial [Anaplasma sp.]|nr:type IV secretion system protein VirB2-8 [Anaplasma sp.]